MAKKIDNINDGETLDLGTDLPTGFSSQEEYEEFLQWKELSERLGDEVITEEVKEEPAPTPDEEEITVEEAMEEEEVGEEKVQEEDTVEEIPATEPVPVRSQDEVIESSSPKPKGLPTLGEFQAQKQYEQSDEYKQKQAEAQSRAEKLSDGSYVQDLLSKSTLSDAQLSKIKVKSPDKTIKEKKRKRKDKRVIPTYEVTLLQSGYNAEMSSLRFHDIFALSNSTLRTYESHYDRYLTYYNSMNHNTLGIDDFDTWAKVTSFHDINTMVFGIFNQTFPGDTEMNITCQHCGKEMKNVKIPHDQLVSGQKEEVVERLQKLNKSMHSLEEVQELSIVNDLVRFQLPVSKAVIDISIPTVEDHLKLLQEIPNPDDVDIYLDSLLYVDAVNELDLEATEAAQEPIFNKYTSNTDILDFLKDMDISEDASALLRNLEDLDSDYTIEYRIKSFPCQHCGEEVGDIDINIADLLLMEAVAATVNI